MPSVKIRIERGKEQAGDGNSQKMKEDPSKDVSVQSIFAQQMMGIGKQIVSYGTSNVANFSGNYIEQDRINNMLDAIGDVSTVALGFVTKGAVGGAIAIAGITTKKIFETISDMRKDVLQERDRNYLLARSGNSTTNGSRGTEN